MVLVAVGVLLGAGEVAVTAAAKAHGSTTDAAPLFTLWGAGSFLGGLLIARVGSGGRPAVGLALILAALTAGHLALVPVAGSMPALGAGLLLAGAAIAPSEAAVYAMVDAAAPPDTITEAFAWLATAMAVGGAVGAALAGVVVDRAGPSAGFALAAGAGALAVITTVLRVRTLAAGSPPPTASQPQQVLLDERLVLRRGPTRLCPGVPAAKLAVTPARPRRRRAFGN